MHSRDEFTLFFLGCYKSMFIMKNHRDNLEFYIIKSEK